MISSVNHDPQHVGIPLRGEFEVRVVKPDGNPIRRQVFGPTTGHRVPDNYGDVTLAVFDLDDWPLRSWHFEVKVINPDPNFRTTRTEVKLRKQRYDPGMGGLMNYVMMIPAALFLALAFLASLPLAKGGSRAPLIMTVLALSGFMAVLF
jgi:hypothetical protein